MQSDLFSRTAAAQYLGVKPQTLAAWFSTGRYSLPVVKVGRYAKYRLSDLQAFIQANTFAHSGSTQGGELA